MPFESKLYMLCVTSLVALLLASNLTVHSNKKPPILSFPFNAVMSYQVVCNVQGEGMK